jgi:hypothetical protein
LTSQFLAPPTTEGREYLNLNAGKTNLTFEQGIIFAYCPKTKKFMFVKPNQDDK